MTNYVCPPFDMPTPHPHMEAMIEPRPITSEISRRVIAAFAPTQLEVIDDSAKHRGHGGYREGVETHLTLRITSATFVGKGRVERQRMVFELLRDLMDNPIHALSLDLKPSA
jgi:BolA family transcriptional regulator, general stress-responsive regulator